MTYLDDTDRNGLTHITNGETSERRIVGKGLDAHRLGRNHLDNGCVSGLDELGVVLDGLARTTVNLLEKLGELAGDVGGVAIEHRGITGSDLTGMVEDDDLGVERLTSLGRVILGVTGHVTPTDLLDGNVLDVEADVVTWETLRKLFVVHLNGLDFGGHTGGSKSDDHARLDGSSLDTTNGNGSDTADLVHILKRETERLINRTSRRLNAVNGLKKCLSSDLTGLDLLLPALVPGAVAGGVNHVVAVEARDGDERNGLGIVANLLDEVGRLLNDLIESVFFPSDGVHLVDGDNDLSHTEGIGEKGVFTGLAILGDTSLEFTSTSSNDENSTVGLGSTSDHVLNEVTVAGGIYDSGSVGKSKEGSRRSNREHTDDGNIVLGSLELPESDIDSDTTLTFSLELIEHPGILEGTLAQLGSFLLELLDRCVLELVWHFDRIR